MGFTGKGGVFRGTRGGLSFSGTVRLLLNFAEDFLPLRLGLEDAIGFLVGTGGTGKVCSCKVSRSPVLLTSSGGRGELLCESSEDFHTASVFPGPGDIGGSLLSSTSSKDLLRRAGTRGPI